MYMAGKGFPIFLLSKEYTGETGVYVASSEKSVIQYTGLTR